MMFEHNVKVVFSYLSPEGNVSHTGYARIFGDVRELFGLELIPNFKEDVGKKYLLKTKAASYSFNKDFFFGDDILVRMYVGEITAASFVLKANFLNAKTRDVHAVGEHRIVFTDMLGMPKRLPPELKDLLGKVLEVAEAA